LGIAELVASRFGSDVKRVGKEALGLAVHEVAERVREKRPALAPHVAELEKNVLSRLGDQEKGWRPG
jgi:hypothetical protein